MLSVFIFLSLTTVAGISFYGLFRLQYSRNIQEQWVITQNNSQEQWKINLTREDIGLKQSEEILKRLHDLEETQRAHTRQLGLQATQKVRT